MSIAISKRVQLSRKSGRREVPLARSGRPIADHSEAGMTLLELTIAAAIMASTLVFILGSIVSLSMTSDVAADQASTMTYMTTVVEELHRATESDLRAYAPPTPLTQDIEQTVTIEYVLNADGATISPPIPEPVVGGLGGTQAEVNLPNPLHVRVTVDALSKSGRHFTMQTATMVRR